MKPKITQNRHDRSDARVDLWKDGKPKTWLVSRLVGIVWCNGYAAGMTINHINGNSLDNRATNLEWVTLAENIHKGFCDGLYSSCQNPVCLMRENQVIQFASMAEASRFLGRNKGYISNCIKRKHQISDERGMKYVVCDFLPRHLKEGAP